MRNLYYYLIPDSLQTIGFAHFQLLLLFEIIFYSSPTVIKQKRKIRVILGLRQRTSGRQKFKKLQTVNLPRLYILETVILAKNPDNYQTNIYNHSRDMGQIADFIYEQ